MEPWTVREDGICWLEFLTWKHDGCIGQSGSFANEIYHVLSEPIYLLVEPEFHHRMYCFPHLGLLPVQIWLRGEEAVEIVLACVFVPFPDTPYVLLAVF
jgi:hypothetical protein